MRIAKTSTLACVDCDHLDQPASKSVIRGIDGMKFVRSFRVYLRFNF